jgi:hypothetical protein
MLVVQFPKTRLFRTWLPSGDQDELKMRCSHSREMKCTDLGGSSGDRRTRLVLFGQCFWAAKILSTSVQAMWNDLSLVP